MANRRRLSAVGRELLQSAMATEDAAAASGRSDAGGGKGIAATPSGVGLTVANRELTPCDWQPRFKSRVHAITHVLEKWQNHYVSEAQR